MATVYWMGRTENCDICHQSFGKVMYDAVTRFGWACMCQSCREAHGPRTLGTGLGQKYEKQEDGQWLKTQG